MRVEMCTGMCISLRIDTPYWVRTYASACACMRMDMCIDNRVYVQACHVRTCVCTHVRRHVCRHVCGRVCGQVCRRVREYKRVHVKMTTMLFQHCSDNRYVGCTTDPPIHLPCACTDCPSTFHLSLRQWRVQPHLHEPRCSVLPLLRANNYIGHKYT